MEALYTLLLYPLLCAAAWYLGSYAKITAPVHTRLPAALQSYLACPACSGTLYGFLVAVVLGRGYGLPFLGLRGDEGLVPILVAGCSMIWTPIVGGWLMGAMASIERDVKELTEGTPHDRIAEKVLPMMEVAFAYLRENADKRAAQPESPKGYDSWEDYVYAVAADKDLKLLQEGVDNGWIVWDAHRGHYTIPALPGARMGGPLLRPTIREVPLHTPGVTPLEPLRTVGVTPPADDITPLERPPSKGA